MDVVTVTLPTGGQTKDIGCLHDSHLPELMSYEKRLKKGD